MKKFPSLGTYSGDATDDDDGLDDDDDMSFMSYMFPKVSKESLIQSAGNNCNNKYSPLTLPSVLREALPLMRFADSIHLVAPKVLTGETIRTVASVDLENNCSTTSPYAHRQLKCLKLARFYRKRCQEEEIMRREDVSYSNGNDDSVTVSSSATGADREKRIKYKMLYESSLFTPLKKGKIVATVTTGDDDEDNESPGCNQDLVFDSDFECGNLESATRVNGRGIFDNLYNSLELQAVQQEYDLTLRNDINTNGNIQWFYFSITANSQSSHAARVRINIINFTKNDSLYNYGLQPVACIVSAQDTTNALQWTHVGADIAYYPNGKTIAIRKKKDKVLIKKLYTLSFSMIIEPGQRIYLAHCYPYSYSDLQRYLAQLESKDSISDIFHRRLLCKTLCGNRCDMLIITARSDVVETTKPAIIISARVHPGESNSSFIIQGIINYLLDKDNKDAGILRKNFIFKIVPMLNPDGVIHGNYRCSLAGVDLNRQYNKPVAYAPLLPTVVAFKDMIECTRNQRGVTLFLDIHGHSKKKNAFLYGCDYSQQGAERDRKYSHFASKIKDQRVFCRIFPAILCKISEYFSEEDCSFSVAKSKGGTGRVVSWKDFGVEGSYTIEASFCSNGDNGRDKVNNSLLKDLLKKDIDTTSCDMNEFDQSLSVDHYTQVDYQEMGCDVLRGILHYSNLKTPLGDDRSVDTSRAAHYINSDDDTADTDVNIQLNPILRYTSDMLLRPLTLPGVFDQHLLPTSTDSASTIRLLCETEIRMKLKSTDSAVDSGGIENRECTTYNSDGSDSEPSVDNMPIDKVFKRLSGGSKDSSTAEIVQAFRKMTIQRCKKLRKTLEEKVRNLLNNADDSAAPPAMAATPKDKPKMQSFKSITSTITAIKRLKTKISKQDNGSFKIDKRVVRATSGSDGIGNGPSTALGTSALLRKNSVGGSQSADFLSNNPQSMLPSDVITTDVNASGMTSSSASIIQFITEGIKDTGSEDIFTHKSFKPLSNMKQRPDNNKWGVPLSSPVSLGKKALSPFSTDTIKNLAVSYDSNTASPSGSIKFSKPSATMTRGANTAIYSANDSSSYSPLKASVITTINPFTVNRLVGQDVVVQLNERPTVVFPNSDLSPKPSRKTMNASSGMFDQRLHSKN